MDCVDNICVPNDPFFLFLFVQVKNNSVIKAFYKGWQFTSEEHSNMYGFFAPKRKGLKLPLILHFLVPRVLFYHIFQHQRQRHMSFFSNSNVGFTGPPSKALRRAWVLSSERALSAWQQGLETLRMCLQLEAAKTSGKKKEGGGQAGDVASRCCLLLHRAPLGGAVSPCSHTPASPKPQLLNFSRQRSHIWKKWLGFVLGFFQGLLPLSSRGFLSLSLCRLNLSKRRKKKCLCLCDSNRQDYACSLHTLTWPAVGLRLWITLPHYGSHCLSGDLCVLVIRTTLSSSSCTPSSINQDDTNSASNKLGLWLKCSELLNQILKLYEHRKHAWLLFKASPEGEPAQTRSVHSKR